MHIMLLRIQKNYYEVVFLEELFQQKIFKNTYMNAHTQNLKNQLRWTPFEK